MRLTRGVSPVTRQVRMLVLTVLGVLLAAMPIALWVAWSEDLFWGVLAAGGLSAALWILLAEKWDPSIEDRSPSGAVGERAALSDEFFVEVHRLFPLTYHHSRIPKVRFRRAMEKMRALTPR